MKSFTAVVEKCPDTGLAVGHVPGFAGAHSQGDCLDELKRNLEAVLITVSQGKEFCPCDFVRDSWARLGPRGESAKRTYVVEHREDGQVTAVTTPRT